MSRAAELRRRLAEINKAMKNAPSRNVYDDLKFEKSDILQELYNCEDDE